MAEPMLSPVPDLPAGSPPWWVDRLSRRLAQRQVDMDLLQRYAAGDADDPWISDRASRAFRRIMGLSKTNLCGLIVEAVADRNAVSGFRFGDNPDADADAWRIWQSSDFDAESELAIRAALVNRRSFLSVAPGDSEGDMPTLYAEDPRQVIVAYEPGKRRNRLAGLKTWVDEWTGKTRANLYLPGELHRLVDASSSKSQTPRWESFDDKVAKNPLGEVPIFELRNRPSIDGSVMAEHEDVLPDQDRANHIALNALIATEYGAFRQKWATGLEIPRNPETGAPVEPFETAIDRLFVNEDPDGKFGDFNATDLKPYIDLYESTVRHMAAVSRTPAAYMLGHIANLSAEALAAAEAGLVMKCKARQRGYNGAFEDMMRCAFRAMGDPRADETNAETDWVNPEVKSDAQLADAAVKLTQGDRPILAVETAQEFYLGMGPTERERDKVRRDDSDTLGEFASMLERQVTDLGAVPTPVPPAQPVAPPADA